MHFRVLMLSDKPDVASQAIKQAVRNQSQENLLLPLPIGSVQRQHDRDDYYTDRKPAGWQTPLTGHNQISHKISKKI